MFYFFLQPVEQPTQHGWGGRMVRIIGETRSGGSCVQAKTTADDGRRVQASPWRHAQTQPLCQAWPIAQKETGQF